MPSPAASGSQSERLPEDRSSAISIATMPLRSSAGRTLTQSACAPAVELLTTSPFLPAVGSSHSGALSLSRGASLSPVGLPEAYRRLLESTLRQDSRCGLTLPQQEVDHQ